MLVLTRKIGQKIIVGERDYIICPQSFQIGENGASVRLSVTKKGELPVWQECSLHASTTGTYHAGKIECVEIYEIKIKVIRAKITGESKSVILKYPMVSIAVEASRDISIHREEIYEKIKNYGEIDGNVA